MNDQSKPWGNAAATQNYQTLEIKRLYDVKRETVSPEDFIVIRDRLLLEWEEKKKALTVAKDAEMHLRTVVTSFISDPEKTKGTENVELGNGYVAKVVKKETYTFVQNAEGKIDKAKIDHALDEIEAKIDGGRIIADRLVKWTPDLSLTEYNQLPAEAKAIIDPVLVVKQGAPTLEIKAPKS